MKKRSAHSHRTRRSTRRSSRRYTRGFNTNLLPVIMIAVFLVGGITVASVKKRSNELASSQGSVLSESDSGSGSSGGSGGGGSGSGDSGRGSSGSGSSDSGGSGSGSGDSGSGSSGSNTSGSGSSGSGTSGSGTSGSRSITPRPTSTPRFSPTPLPSPTPVRTDEEIQVQEGQTRLEQEIFEGGVRKRIEMRNENGRVRVRVKTEDALGNETEQRLELRPEEGIARLRVTEGGLEKDVTVRVQNDRFVISQEGFNTAVPGGEIAATTNFPVTIDKETNSIAIETPIGTVNVQQLPSTAIEQALASNVLDVVQSTELGESEAEQDEAETPDPNKQVVYRIQGVKNTKFLGFIGVDAPILAEVSAMTGEQVFVKQPWYLNAFGFLFAK